MTPFRRHLQPLGAILTITVLIMTGPWFIAQPASGQTEDNVYKVDLATLGYSSQVLVGPDDTASYTFRLPANWLPQAGTYLQLDLAYLVNSETDIGPSLLQVELNSELVHTERFITSTVKSLRIDIPPDILRLAEEAAPNNLLLTMQNSGRCEEVGDSIQLVIQSSSSLSFAYSERALPLDLALYPKPLYYRDAFETAPAGILLRPQPSASELEAVAMIAANLGSLTRNNLALQVSLGETPSITTTEQHLIMIGSAQRMPLLSKLELPVPLRERRLSLRSQMPATISPGRPFSYTLTIENTSKVNQSLTVEDRLSPLAEIQACQACDQVTPGMLHWQVNNLAPSETISTEVRVLPSQALAAGQVIEHTASLRDVTGEVINVDTLTSTVGSASAPAISSAHTSEADHALVSTPGKGSYFFAIDDQGVPETDGIVQMVQAPWSAKHAVVLVSGLDDTAVSLAAHALAAQSSMPGMHGQFAIVQATRPISVTSALSPQDILLTDLGYDDQMIRGRNGHLSIEFDVPHSTRVTEEAYLRLHLAHGMALNTISATLELSLNNLPFHSIELQPKNAVDSWIKVPLPSQRLRPGHNQLDIDIVADWPICLGSEENSRFWVTILDNSFLHLPYTGQQGLPILNLANYPRFLTAQPGLQDLVLLLPEQVTPDEAQGMTQLFSFLGDAARGEYFTPQVIFSTQPSLDKWQDHNLIVLGRPTGNPYIAQVNDELPQPFVPGRDEIRQQVDNIIYRLPPGYSLGYIQLLPVPWDQDRAMFIVTGTTDVGLNWALSAAGNRELVRHMSGNLAVMIGADEMHSTDTRQAMPDNQLSQPLVESSKPIAEATATPNLTPTATPGLAATPPAGTSTAINVRLDAADAPNSYHPPLWGILLLALSGVVVAGAFGLAIWQRHS